MSRWNYAVD